jgi:hypothetical protein
VSSPKAPPASVTRKGSSVGPLPFLMLQARFCRNGPFEPPFFHPEAAVITPKVQLGADYVPDFVIELRRRRYIFVEVEHPQH